MATPLALTQPRHAFLTCVGCGQVLEHGGRERNPRKWCSEACRVRAFRGQNPGYVRRNSEQAAERHRATYVPVVHASSCTECGATVVGSRRKKYCSRKCSARAYAARRRADGRRAEMSAKRRALEAGAKVQGGRRQAVLEADDWICHLCGAPTDRTVKYPHPEYPVVDHVVPLAKGGEHAPANWRTAHNRCNSVRRDMSVAECRARFTAA